MTLRNAIEKGLIESGAQSTTKGPTHHYGPQVEAISKAVSEWMKRSTACPDCKSDIRIVVHKSKCTGHDYTDIKVCDHCNAMNDKHYVGCDKPER